MTFTDEDGTAKDSYTIPTIIGVDYLVGGVAKSAGTYPGTRTITVTAKAKPDYTLSVWVLAIWSKTFSVAPIEATPGVVVFVDKSGTAYDTYTIPDTDGWTIS